MIRRFLLGGALSLALDASVHAQAINTPPAPSSPGGSTTQVQYNSSGAFAGSSGFTTDGTSITLTAGVNVGAGSNITSSGRGNIRFSADGRLAVTNSSSTNNASLNATGFLRLTPTTVAGLATIDASPAAGDRAAVTDADACVFGSTVAHTAGSTFCPVVYTGAAWVAG